MTQHLHNKAEAAGSAFVVDAHNYLDHLSGEGEKLADAVLSGEEGKIAHVHGRGGRKGLIVTGLRFVIFPIVVGVLRFEDVV